MKIHFKQNVYDSRELEKNSDFLKLEHRVISFGPNFIEKDEGHAFENPGEFVNWAKQNAPEFNIEAVYKDVEKSKKEVNDNAPYIKVRNLEKAKRIKNDLDDLAKHTRLDLHSKDLFVKATTEPLITTGSIFDSVIVYQHANFKGEWRAVGNPEPDLSWYPGWNDSISSIRGNEFVILYEHAYFNGASRTFHGPYFEVRNLNNLGFNDKCSSIFTK